MRRPRRLTATPADVLVPAGRPRRARRTASADGGHAARGWPTSRHGAPVMARQPSRYVRLSTQLTIPSAPSGSARGRLRHARQPRGHLQPLRAPRPGHQPGQGHGPRVGGDGHAARRLDGEDGRAYRRRRRPSLTGGRRDRIARRSRSRSLRDRRRRRSDEGHSAHGEGLPPGHERSLAPRGPRRAAPADVREVIGRRELYRRMSRIAESVGEVADRVWYASVKET